MKDEALASMRTRDLKRLLMKYGERESEINKILDHEEMVARVVSARARAAAQQPGCARRVVC